MSAVKKQRPYANPLRETADKQESLRLIKMEAERIKEKIQKSILDHPAKAKKAALLLTLWINKKSKREMK